MAKEYEIAFRLAAQLGANFSKTFQNAAKTVEQTSGKITAAATAAAAAGGLIAAGAGAIGIGAVTVAGDYQKAMNQIQMSTGATAEQMGEVGDIAKSLYSQNFGENWDDLAKTIATVQSVTKLQGDELERVTQNALLMRDTFEFDVNESVKAADTMMKNFGVTSDQAYSLLTQGAQQGLNKSDELLDTANEYSVFFNSLGFSANEMFDTFSAGLEAGAFGLDKVGDAVKEFNIRAKDGSKGTTEAFQALGMDAANMAQTFARGGPEAKAAFKQVLQAISSIEDPVKRNTVGVQLMGTQFEDMEAGVIAAMGTAQSKFDGAKNTMDEMNKVRLDTPGQFLSALGRQIQTGFLLPLGQKAMPLFRTFYDWTQTALPVIQQTAAAAFQSVGDIAGKLADKLSFVGDAWTVAASIFSGGNFNMDAWTGLVDKLTGLGLDGGQAVGFAQSFTKSMMTVKDSFDAVTNGAKLLFSLLGGGADLNAWSGLQTALQKLGVSQEGAFQFATKLTAGFLKIKDTVGSVLQTIGQGLLQFGQQTQTQLTGWLPAIIGVVQKLLPYMGTMAASLGAAIQKVIPVVFQVASTAQAVVMRIIKALMPVVDFIVTRIVPVIAGIFTFIATSVIPQVASIISALLPKITAIADKLGETFTAIWGFIQPIIGGIVTAFEWAFPLIQSIVTNAVTMIGGVISGIMDIFGGVLDFITGVFTGNWEKAWQGVKDIFGGIMSTLGAVLAFPINMAIDGINAAIHGLNKVKIDVPEWVPGFGGKSFSLGIPEIPKIGGYAEGGIVDRPELAWIGEGGDREVIVPINNSERSFSLWQAAGQMLGVSRGSGPSGGSPVPAEPAVVIQYNPTINAPGAGQDILQQIAAMLAADKANVKKIVDEALNGGKRLGYG